MGAIFGLCWREPAAPHAPEWARAVDRSRCFGRDGVFEWRAESIALGRAVNRVRERAAADAIGLPGDCAHLHAVASLRLDNRRELLTTLDLPPRVSDTVVVMVAWARWGELLAERLQGDFALALWDERARVLFLARDRVGMRPLFFHAAGSRFAFASAPSILGELMPGGLRVEPMDWAAAFLRRPRDPALTLWSGVQRLLPGCWLRLQAPTGELDIRRYWHPSTGLDPVVTVEAAVDEARAVFESEVARQAEDGRVGALLSGGLDSSWMVAALVGSGRVDELDCVASVLPPGHAGPERDERAQQACLRAQLPGLRLHPIESLSGDPLDIGDTCRSTGLMVNPFHRMDDALFGRLAALGVRTVFTGFGGDFMLSYQGAGWLARGWRELGPVASLGVLRAVADFRGRSIWREFAAEVRRSLPALLQRPPWRGDRMLAAPLRAALDATRAPRPAEFGQQLRERALAGSAAIEEMSLVAARHGLELALPFLSPAVTVLSLRVPAASYVAGGRPRGLAREAMRGRVPDEVRLRKDKQAYWPGFGAALRAHWSDYQGEWRELRDGPGMDPGAWLDPDHLDAVFRGGPSDAVGWGRELPLLEVAMVVAAWRFLSACGALGGR